MTEAFKFFFTSEGLSHSYRYV